MYRGVDLPQELEKSAVMFSSNDPVYIALSAKGQNSVLSDIVLGTDRLPVQVYCSLSQSKPY